MFAIFHISFQVTKTLEKLCFFFFPKKIALEVKKEMENLCNYASKQDIHPEFKGPRVEVKNEKIILK